MKIDTISKNKIHHEDIFEKHIVESLVKGLNYIQRDCESDYDQTFALDKELFFKFLEETQPKEWKSLQDNYKESAKSELLKRFEQKVKSSSIHQVLREGINLIPNINFSLIFFKPASNLNNELTNLHKKNILSVIRQVQYSKKNKNAIDIVTFINGIPIITIEVKNNLTSQNYKHAEKQYRQDRSPYGEPLLTFKRGAIVHFAMDQQYISMSTKLINEKTKFLPFNRGRDNGSGNPDIKNENRVAYLYKNIPNNLAILSLEVISSIIGKFIHLEIKEGKEKLIFPRYHQLNAVQKILSDARINGSGKNYLIQHSAGSGKSNTIAWISHQIINLHDEDDKPLFDAAVVVTDRVVLDRHLQKTITNFNQTDGLVKKIDGTSKDLKQALEEGKRIIITTIQKFNTDYLSTLSGQSNKKFALIIDEAHSSQSGKSAQSMVDVLTREEELLDDINNYILKSQSSRGPQKNISFLAFTATPKNVTLERFGILGDDHIPYPFDLYSMRQAIEENFIIDVLQNYTTYGAYYQLEKTIQENPILKGRKGQARVARYATLHKTSISKKVEVIVEHFRTHVKKEIKGKAKAMVVTQSREHAIRFWQEIKQYIKNKNYSDLSALVAFSDEIKVDGKKWTEVKANGFSETELPKQFDKDTHKFLIVADKYQTGFDQPKLIAMYVDKKLYGLQAVQTLSRLNRVYPEKKNTYILDFRNSIVEIKEAFTPYFETTELEERTDLNQIYDLSSRVKNSSYINSNEIESFGKIFFRGSLTTDDRIELENIVRLCVSRFEDESEEQLKEEFRLLLKSYQRFYIFVSQIINLKDPWLEKLYIYSSWLIRLLPLKDRSGEINISENMLNLSAFTLRQEEEGKASLLPGESTTLSPISAFGANPYTEDEEKSLSDIIDTFNERYGTAFSKDDFLRFEKINNEIMNDEMKEMMLNNPPDVVYNAFSEKFLSGMIKLFNTDNEFKNIFLQDPEARDKAIKHFFKRAQGMLEN